MGFNPTVFLNKYFLSKIYRPRNVRFVRWYRRRISYPRWLFRSGLIKRYRRRIYFSCQNKNFFITSNLSLFPINFSISTGSLPAYKGSTRKKKTSMSGSELLNSFLKRHTSPFFRVKSFWISSRGRLPARKGAIKELTKNYKARIFRYSDATSLVFNGTRPVRSRRL